MALATRPKPKVQHKKRQAKHHRQDKQYIKAYWPYLPMLLIVGLGLNFSGTWSQNSVLGSQRDISATSLLTATNSQRAKQDKAPLVIDTKLAAAAQAKAQDMVSDNYWSHTAPTGETAWTFIDASGYQYQKAGENLAYGFVSADNTVSGWMNSSEHRANILNSDYRNVGFGVAQSPNYQGKGPQTIIVAEYAQPTVSGSSVFVSAGSTTPLNLSTRAEAAAQPVSRLAVLTGGQAAWSLFAVSLVSVSALLYFIAHHSMRLRRAFTTGEHFVLKHPLLDIMVVLLFTAGFVVTRTTGLIR